MQDFQMGDQTTTPTPASLLSRLDSASRADITPPIGVYTREWGAAEHSTAKSIHRPLQLTALTLHAQTDGEPLVFVEADLGFWRNRKLFAELRARIREKLSVESPRFMFGLTHTHSSATLAEPDPSLPGGELLEPYIERIEQAGRAIDRIGSARRAEAILDWNYGKCGLATNRDLPDPAPASSRYVCGYNPNVTADDTLLVGRATLPSGKPLATLVNYACHPTTLAWQNRAISPDFVGAMRETIETAIGAPAMFLQGASGDLAPGYQYVGDPQVADRHGRHLGYAALATLEDMEPPGTRLVFDRVVEVGRTAGRVASRTGFPSTLPGGSGVECRIPLRIGRMPTSWSGSGSPARTAHGRNGCAANATLV